VSDAVSRMTERKRRKWDVAAPQGIPLTTNASTATISSSVLAGHVAAQGAGNRVAPVVSALVAPPKPGQPLDADTVARAQQGAAAILAKLNKVNLHDIQSNTGE